jgi:hypothetical protein
MIMRCEFFSLFPCSPNYVWGNQEPIWPIKPGALSAKPTPRIMKLAKPKVDFSLDPYLHVYV